MYDIQMNILIPKLSVSNFNLGDINFDTHGHNRILAITDTIGLRG